MCTSELGCLIAIANQGRSDSGVLILLSFIFIVLFVLAALKFYEFAAVRRRFIYERIPLTSVQVE